MSGEIEEEEELPPRGFVDPRARLPKEILDELEAEEAEEAAREAARAAAEAAEEPLNPQDVEIRFEDYHDGFRPFGGSATDQNKARVILTRPGPVVVVVVNRRRGCGRAGG